ncbi:hypothetical protein VIGAN_11044900, partial [Vigna angularis var. angularis]
RRKKMFPLNLIELRLQWRLSTSIPIKQLLLLVIFLRAMIRLRIMPKDGNESGQVRIVPTSNPIRWIKLYPLPVGYPFKKYPQIF